MINLCVCCLSKKKKMKKLYPPVFTVQLFFFIMNNLLKKKKNQALIAQQMKPNVPRYGFFFSFFKKTRFPYVTVRRVHHRLRNAGLSNVFEKYFQTRTREFLFSMGRGWAKSRSKVFQRNSKVKP